MCIRPKSHNYRCRVDQQLQKSPQKLLPKHLGTFFIRRDPGPPPEILSHLSCCFCCCFVCLKCQHDSGDGSDLRSARLGGFCQLFQLQDLGCVDSLWAPHISSERRFYLESNVSLLLGKINKSFSKKNSPKQSS